MFHRFSCLDMRFGRNVVRSLFEYYRFTSVLAIPMYTQLSTHRKGRPKTHRERGRSRRRISPTVQPRPKTTRENAPISYNDLFIRGYDSGSSVEASPVRYAHYNQGRRTTKTTTHLANQDQFSLLTIQESKFSQLDFTNEFRLPKLRQITKPPNTRPDTINNATSLGSDKMNIVTPKPYLSIIDFNQITRGGLERATQRCNEKRLGKHKL